MEFSAALQEIILPVLSVLGVISAAILYMSKINAKQDIKLAKITECLTGIKGSITKIETNHLRHIETDIRTITESLIEVKTRFSDHIDQHKNNQV